MTLFESQRDDNEYQNLYEEEILIAVPEAWNLEGAVMEAGKRRPRLPLLALKDRPMILLRKQTTMRPVLDRLFRARQVVPQILFDTANLPPSWKWSGPGSAAASWRNPLPRASNRGSGTIPLKSPSAGTWQSATPKEPF